MPISTQHTGIKVTAVVLAASLHFTVMYSYLHLFVNDNHVTCEEYAKLHLHKKDIACDVLSTFKLNNQLGFIPDNFNLLIPKYIIKPVFNAYTFPARHIDIHFLRRGPPRFS